MGSVAGGQVVGQVRAALSLAVSFTAFVLWLLGGMTHCHSALATVSPFPGTCPPFGAVTGSVPATSPGNPCGIELVDSFPQLLGVSLLPLYCVAYPWVYACSVVSDSL